MEVESLVVDVGQGGGRVVEQLTEGTFQSTFGFLLINQVDCNLKMYKLIGKDKQAFNLK